MGVRRRLVQKAVAGLASSCGFRSFHSSASRPDDEHPLAELGNTVVGSLQHPDAGLVSQSGRSLLHVLDEATALHGEQANHVLDDEGLWPELG